MKLIKAITIQIAEMEQPVITLYQLGVIVFHLYREKSLRGEAIPSIKKDFADYQALMNAVAHLIDNGFLEPYKGFPRNSVYKVFGKENYLPSEVACSIDPFCFVSHLSAMEYHGLTNRISSSLYLSSPGKGDWKNFALAKMEKDIGDDLTQYLGEHLPVLRKTTLEKIDRTIVYRHNSVHLGAFKKVQNKMLRVATVGRTFLDMLKNPELCGGIAHVLEVYEQSAELYLPLIINEISNQGRPIDKVRAGYILDERLGLHNSEIDSWVEFAQRGGSRKLDASAEYIPEFSEKWCLSINVF